MVSRCRSKSISRPPEYVPVRVSCVNVSRSALPVTSNRVDALNGYAAVRMGPTLVCRSMISWMAVVPAAGSSIRVR
jgi:hypothetical protein